MFIKNAAGLKNAIFEPLMYHTMDADGNPIWMGDGHGIDWDNVKK